MAIFVRDLASSWVNHIMTTLHVGIQLGTSLIVLRMSFQWLVYRHKIEDVFAVLSILFTGTCCGGKTDRAKKTTSSPQIII